MKDDLIEREAAAAFLLHQSELSFARQCTGRHALYAAAHAIRGGEHTGFHVQCIGCEQPIGTRAYVSDENGETGCPACFTDDGSGVCWKDEPSPASRIESLTAERDSSAGYKEAFYQIAELLGIPAQDKSPREVFEEQMLPAIRTALEPTP